MSDEFEIPEFLMSNGKDREGLIKGWSKPVWGKPKTMTFRLSFETHYKLETIFQMYPNMTRSQVFSDIVDVIYNEMIEREAENNPERLNAVINEVGKTAMTELTEEGK